jgi:hypothetical protein
MKQPTNISDDNLTFFRQKLEQLEAELADLRKSQTNGYDTQLAGITDRRGMLKKVAGLAVGVATVGLLKPTGSRAADNKLNGNEIWPDANDDPLLMGHNDNAGTSDTGVLQLSGSHFNVTNTGAALANGAVLRAFNFVLAVPPIDPTDHSIGVLGSATSGASNTDVTGVFGAATASGSGSVATGVKGMGDLVGVEGIADASSSSRGIQGTSLLGRGARFIGLRAAITLNAQTGAVANPNSNNPTGGDIGDLYRSPVAAGSVGNGGIWYRPSSSAGTYRRLADNTTAGALTLQAPVRLVDTRANSGFFDAGNPFVGDQTRSYDIKTLASLPDGTRGIIGRITVDGATNGGVIQESPNNDFSGVGTAVVNYPSANVIRNFGATFISLLNSTTNPGQIFVRGFTGMGGQVDVIIDLVGFYL